MLNTELPIIGQVKSNTTTIQPLSDYDHVLVSFSGGKDSIASVINILSLGVHPSKITLMHQCVDGEEYYPSFFDWPCTRSYCEEFAKAMGLRMRFQWRHRGFYGEAMKYYDRTKSVSFQCLDGTVKTAGGEKGKISTRRMFPQVTANLRQRWCSSILKIDVSAIAINNDPELKNSNILFLSGERREESSARARYAEMEPHRTHTKSRHVDHWRSVIDFPETKVWDYIKAFKIVPHPAYRLGWSRLSCMACIFGQANQWASIRKIHLGVFNKIACMELQFGKTIHRTKSVMDLANEGTPYPGCDDEALIEEALSRSYTGGIFTDDWKMPAGAFGHSGGPS